MVDEIANLIPTNTVPSEVPSNGTPHEEQSSSGGGSPVGAVPMGGTVSDIAFGTQPLPVRGEPDMIKLPVEQFTAMVGVLLSAVGESGGRQTPSPPGPRREDADERREARVPRGEARREEGAGDGLGRGVGGVRNRGAGRNGEDRGERREPRGNEGGVGGREQRQRDGGRPRERTRIPSGVILEEVDPATLPSKFGNYAER